MTTSDQLRQRPVPDTRPAAAGSGLVSRVVDGHVVPQPRRAARLVVDTRPLPRRRVHRRSVVGRAVLVFVGALPFVGVAGYVAGRLGADVIGRVLTALGGLTAAGFLLYALATLRHRAPGHHCPGCPDH